MIFAIGLGLGILASFMIDFAARKNIREKLRMHRAYTRELEKEYTSLCIIHKYQKEAVKLLSNVYDFVYSDPSFTEEYRLYMRNKIEAEQEIDNLEKFMNQQQKEKK